MKNPNAAPAALPVEPIAVRPAAAPADPHAPVSSRAPYGHPDYIFPKEVHTFWSWRSRRT